VLQSTKCFQQKKPELETVTIVIPKISAAGALPAFVAKAGHGQNNVTQIRRKHHTAHQNQPSHASV
jgi:hypothetical protein